MILDRSKIEIERVKNNSTGEDENIYRYKGLRLNGKYEDFEDKALVTTYQLRGKDPENLIKIENFKTTEKRKQLEVTMGKAIEAHRENKIK